MPAAILSPREHALRGADGLLDAVARVGLAQHELRAAERLDAALGVDLLDRHLCAHLLELPLARPPARERRDERDLHVVGGRRRRGRGGEQQARPTSERVRSDIRDLLLSGTQDSGDGRDYSIRPPDFSRSAARGATRRLARAPARRLRGHTSAFAIRRAMKDVDRVADVQALSEPDRRRRARVDAQPLRVMPRAERVDGIGRHRSGRRHVGQ